MDMSIFLTESAKKHFIKLTNEEKAISLSVKKSGCSGFKYVLKVIDELPQKIYDFQGVKFSILPEDEKALNNLVIDYQREGLNSKIVYDNPNSMNECGCGESFSIKGA